MPLCARTLKHGGFCPKARAPRDVNFHLLLSSVRPIIFLSLFKRSRNSLSLERGWQKSLSFPFFFSCRERPLLIELIGKPNSFTWRVGGGHPDPEISGGGGGTGNDLSNCQYPQMVIICPSISPIFTPRKGLQAV